MCVCEGLLLQEQETVQEEREGFIVYDIIESARKHKVSHLFLSMKHLSSSCSSGISAPGGRGGDEV